MLSIVLIFFSSCSYNTQAKLKVFSGYVNGSKNNQQEATVDFLAAYDIGVEQKNNTIIEYSNLALASSYFMQHEIEAAENRLMNIKDIHNKDVKEAAAYLRGLTSFHNNDYEHAADYFKIALKINPNNIDTKINYEITIKKLHHEKNTAALDQEQLQIRSNEEKQAENIIFHIIHEQEKLKWEKNTTENTDKQANDY